MRISRTLGLALAVALLSACAEDADDTDALTTDGQVADTLSPAGPGEMMGGETMDGMQTTVVLNELEGSGVAGEAMISQGASAGQTTVEVTLNVADNGSGEHQGHIHQGTCTEIGSVAFPLEPVTTTGGTGTATSTVDADLMSIMDGGHIVIYHQADQQPGSPAVCGEIPGHMM